MKPNDMKFVFLNTWDKLSNLTAPGYDDRQIADFINRAQDEVVFTKYNPAGNKYGQGFEQSEKRMRDMAELITSVVVSGEYSSGSLRYTGSSTSGSNIVNITAYVNKDNNLVTSEPVGLAEGVLISGTGIPTQDANGQPTKITQIIGGNSTTGWNVKISIAATTTSVFDGGAAGYISSGVGISYNQMGANDNGTLFDLPPLYMYTIHEGVVTTEELNAYVPVKPIQHDWYYSNINNTFEKPYKNKIWKLNISRSNKGFGEENDEDGSGNDRSTHKRVELIVGDKETHSIEKYRIRYIKYPRRVIVDEFTPSNQVSCELDESVHNEVVMAAVRLAVASLEPQRYQIQDAEEQKAE